MKRNRSLKRFMIISLLLVVLCVSVVLTGAAVILIKSMTNTAYTDYEQAMNQGYEAEIKSQVQSSVAVLQFYYDRYKSGAMTEAEAKNEAKEAIRSMRYRDDGSGYMWIDSTDYTLIMHPILPQNEGTNRYTLQDQNGVMIIQEIMKTVSSGQGGYNQFYFTKADGVTVALKVAYSEEFKPWGWVVTTGNYVDDMETDMSGVKNSLYTQLNNMVIIMIVLAVILGAIAFVAAIIDGNYIVKPLKQIEGMAKRISEGDISEAAVVKTGNEIGKTADSLNTAQENIKLLISNISDVSASINEVLYDFSDSFSQMSTSINDVSIAVDDIAQNVTSQAHETKTATEDVDNIGDSILNTENEVKVLTDNAKNMQNLGAKSMEALNNLVDISNNTRVQIDDMFNQTERTNESVNKIKNVANMINDIAEQTDLLALNASIEAARVGEAGKGFAVVAEQIGNLARQSGENVVEIGNVIEELLHNSNQSLETMQGMMEYIKKQYEYIYATQKDVEELNGSLISCVDSVSIIGNMTRDIELQRQNITAVLTKLNNIAQDNAASTQETSAMSEELTATVDSSNAAVHALEEKVEILVESVGKFKIN